MGTTEKGLQCQHCDTTFFPITKDSTLCHKCYKKDMKRKTYKQNRIAKRNTKKYNISREELNPLPPINIDTEPVNKIIEKVETVTRALTGDEKATVAYLLAKFVHINDIRTYFAEDGNKVIAHESIKSIKTSKKWQPVIEKYRSEWLARIKEVPIANKRVRMEAWQVMLEDGFNTKKMGTVKNALQGAREEIEGLATHFSGGGNNYSLTYIANMSNNELLQKRDELMKKIKRITKSVKEEPFSEEETIEVPTVATEVKENEDNW